MSACLAIGVLRKNVQKRRARPKRSIDNPGADHDLGLWVDYELLKKHQGRKPEILITGAVDATQNRYLQLADIALKDKKPKKARSAKDQQLH